MEQGTFVKTMQSEQAQKSSISVAHDALEQTLVNLQDVSERLHARVDRFMQPDSRIDALNKTSPEGANPDASREQNMIWNANRLVTEVTRQLEDIVERIDL